MPLNLEIVTPEARVYSDTVDTVIVPTLEGEIGILPGHIPLVSQVDDGELCVVKDGAPKFLAVGGGFVQVTGDRVSVLAEHACTEERIDEHAVEAALERARKELEAAKNLDPNQSEHLQQLIRFSGTQLALKRRRR